MRYRFYKDGEIVETNNLTKFCRDNNLSATRMRGIHYGDFREHQGYTSARKVIMGVHECKDMLKKMRKQLEADIQYLDALVLRFDEYSLAIGNKRHDIKRLEFNIGKLYDESRAELQTAALADGPPKYLLRSPEGDLFAASTFRQMHDQWGLDKSMLTKLIKGDVDHVKGWTFECRMGEQAKTKNEE